MAVRETGLDIFQDLLTEAQEAEVLRIASVAPLRVRSPAAWHPCGDERYRVERYGRMVYATSIVSGVIPPYLAELGRILVERGVLEREPNSVTLNEYRPGHGLAYHIDRATGGEVIGVLGLAGAAVLGFRRAGESEVEKVDFPARSGMRLAGAARWEYEHSVLPVASRRISIVFRRVD